MFHDIESAYNYAVIAGDRDLADRYARVWLWLLRAETDDRQAAKETVHLIRSPANARDLLNGIAEADAGQFVEAAL
jgi:hypothetical protein